MSVPVRGTAVQLEPPGPEPVGLGRFGEFGGRFAPETLVPALAELESQFRDAWNDDAFRAEYASLLSSYVGRPTPVTECHRLSERLGVRVLLKREDLAHTGSHKINNVLGQCLLTRRMGKKKRHRRDRRRPARRGGRDRRRAVRARLHRLHGRGRRRAPGAQRVAHEAARAPRSCPVESGSATLKDAVNEAMRGWVESVESTHYCIGSAMGPHPFPWMVREFQRVVGDEARAQTRELLDGKDPDVRRRVRRRRLERDRHVHGVRRDRRAARRRRGRRPRARERQPRRGREPRRARRRARHALAVPPGRARPGARSDVDQRRPRLSRASVPSTRCSPPTGAPSTTPRPTKRRSTASSCSSATEGIVPALEPAHAIGWLEREAGHAIPKGSTVLVTLSGRGDKDAAQVAERLGEM